MSRGSGYLRIARLALRSRDPARLAAFYRDALGFVDDAHGDDPHAAALVLGGTRLAIVASPLSARPYPGDVPGWSPLFQHFAIRVGDMDGALGHLEAVPGWRAISTSGPETLPPSTGSVVAFKFRDPEGHPLELIGVPGDEGEALFAGIDHTAISVTDVDDSVAFYERIGLVVTGRSLNRGPEQARLDGLEDPVVDVVSLGPPSGDAPHLELLGYRGVYRRDHDEPGPDDVVATRIVFAMPKGAIARSTTLHDPDGHLFELRRG